MKRYLLIILIIINASCDQGTMAYLESLNEGPTINFLSDSETAISDSIKMSLKNSQGSYPISLNVFDTNDNIADVLFEQNIGSGMVMQSGDTIKNRFELDSSGQVIEFDYIPNNLGFHSFKVQVKDNFGESSSVNVELTAFDNLKPVAVFKVAKKGITDRYHYRIEANESFDRDAHYGGGIARYEFTVLGRIDYTQNQDFRDIIFPEDGIYDIAVRVQDNDGAWSEKVVIPDFKVE